jgi:outer membrane protein assembly factor BamA
MLDADYGYERTTLGSSAYDLRTQTAHGRLTIGVTRGLSARFGYTYRQRDYRDNPNGPSLRTHGLDLGIGYDRRLSLTRKTTVSLSSGSSAVTGISRTIYRLSGGARLDREIGRTWSGSIGYIRDVALVEPFSDPFFYDAVSTGLEGFINRRVQLRLLGGYAKGALAFSAQTRHETYSGTADLTFALSRYVAAGASYLYYHYYFNSAIGLPAGVPRQIDRQGVRVNIMLWAPLLYRARTP